MSLILRVFSWLLSRRRRPAARWRAANENTSKKPKQRVGKAPKWTVMAHVIAHDPPVTMLGHRTALEIWNLSDPTRLAFLYLQHGRRLRLPAPAAIVEFGKAARRSRMAE
ncbi:hypothetical protein [Tardiphaga sp.]|jgi:hypothetical protein|uniref:hypothetical protein n=1 Tax=Tardiphaga sp. TaxID=1926292 RepID=UPI0019CC0244|nr:hypothetical protein [Tardiphaga sp.]MBC7575827.1 hypothetical protein [Tardiphaga sp.]